MLQWMHAPGPMKTAEIDIKVKFGLIKGWSEKEAWIKYYLFCHLKDGKDFARARKVER